MLTDNGAIFTGTPRRGGRVALEIELDLLGVRFDHSRPYHPQTCGKVERFHQTQKKWLAAQPPAGRPWPTCNASSTGSAATTTPSDRTARSAAVTPEQAYPARPKATTSQPSIPVHYRVRRDQTDTSGAVTLRYDSRLRHIGLGREHARKRVLVLVADRYIRVVDAETGELLRELTLDPTKDYQPLGRPPGPPKDDRSRSPEMQRCPATPVNGVAGHHTGGADGIRTPNLLIRSQMLYPLSYGRQSRGWPEDWSRIADPRERSRIAQGVQGLRSGQPPSRGRDGVPHPRRALSRTYPFEPQCLTLAVPGAAGQPRLGFTSAACPREPRAARQGHSAAKPRR